jgi:hypothetical protein
MQITHDEIIEDAEQQRQDAERALVALQNYNALIGLMQQYNILIPARTMALWRPTVHTTGYIDGVREGLTIVATDGLLGWYITHDEQAWCGHIAQFSGDIRPLFSFHGPMSSKAKIKQPRKKSKRQTIIDNL